MKGVIPLLVCWAYCAGTRDLSPVLAALVGQIQNIFFPLYTISLRLSPLPSKLCHFTCLLKCERQARQTAGFTHSKRQVTQHDPA